MFAPIVKSVKSEPPTFNVVTVSGTIENVEEFDLIDVEIVGVVNVGEFENTNWPEPLSSLITLSNSSDVVGAKLPRLFANSAMVPLDVGRVSVVVPATALGTNVTEPDVEPGY